jgi:hypothetical protein
MRGEAVTQRVGMDLFLEVWQVSPVCDITPVPPHLTRPFEYLGLIAGTKVNS